ncbi:C-X-C motif chemokine 6-like [Talpa occidentalis]|uniref:C-X-C motif chemokine 6-like n=1 Tax=Talpa occidentalis TaxID=50954 RepID=UPI0023F86F27|nr:C-X-C motif chemokine 6-like [Talpa occidentalis]
MSLRPNQVAGVPHLSGSLCALLALLLLTPARPVASSGPVAVANVRELRCSCLTTATGIHPKMINTLQVIAAGPQCPRVEVVATLKKRKGSVCLDPEAPLIKKIIQKFLNSGNKKK